MGLVRQRKQQAAAFFVKTHTGVARMERVAREVLELVAKNDFIDKGKIHLGSTCPLVARGYRCLPTPPEVLQNSVL